MPSVEHHIDKSPLLSYITLAQETITSSATSITKKGSSQVFELLLIVNMDAHSVTRSLAPISIAICRQVKPGFYRRQL